MPYLESVTEAQHYVEDAQSKIDFSKIGVTLDAAGEQENADNEEEEQIHPDFQHLDTDNADIVEETERNQANIYRTIELPNLSELKERTNAAWTLKY